MMEQSNAEGSRAIFRTLWFRWPWLLDPLQPLIAFTFVQPPEVQELTVTLQGGIKLMDTAFQWETDSSSPTFIWWNTVTEQWDSVHFCFGGLGVLLSVINYKFSLYSRAPLNNSSCLTFFIHSHPFHFKRWIFSCSAVFMCGIFPCGVWGLLDIRRGGRQKIGEKNICKFVLINVRILL